jgi:hypothetical protein
MLTGYNLESSVIGLAALGVMCTSGSSSIVQTKGYETQTSLLASTATHEMVTRSYCLSFALSHTLTFSVSHEMIGPQFR